MVWVLDATGKPQPRRVKLGITNGRETAVLEGELKEGETLITGEMGDEDAAAAQRGGAGGAARSPFAGSTAGPGRRR